MIFPVANLLITIIQIFVWLLIANAILSWLVAFNVINTRNQFIATVGEFLYKITEPVLRPIRNIVPSFGGIDISPIILILLLFFVQNLIAAYVHF
ncbi:MAG: YggT family protein [Sneathiellales bacterium]|nr:YggT family protein [Sneathiellales bacterium]